MHKGCVVLWLMGVLQPFVVCEYCLMWHVGDYSVCMCG